MNKQADIDPTTETPSPNLSTEYQEEGGARDLRDTLDRDPDRDPAGGTIPSDYNPDTMTRKGEEDDTRAGREGAGET